MMRSRGRGQSPCTDVIAIAERGGYDWSAVLSMKSLQHFE